MPAPVSFHVRFLVRDAGILTAAMRRMKDMTVAFEDIVQSWADKVPDKFAQSVGREDAGVDFAGGPHWEPLTTRYQAAKRRAGYPDQLMVRTGELRASLSDPERFFHQETPRSVFFGTPKDQEDYDKLRGNWEARQGLFLDADDRRMIENTIFNFINGTGDYDAGFLGEPDAGPDTDVTVGGAVSLPGAA